MISLRDMRLNIWAAIQAASSTEIQDGMSFYDGAHGLCRLFSQLSNGGKVTPDQVAGIYAALSPMNGWETNVANTLDVVRYGDAATVNTSMPNRDKALAILSGRAPLDVLGGRKVQAFYRGITNPSDTSPIAVDRHLICLAFGNKLDKIELSRVASNRQLYDRVERAYTELGKREGVGNRLAAIAWFVQRRVRNGAQLNLITEASAAVCCGKLATSHGTSPRRFACKVCKRTKTVHATPPVDHLSRLLINSDIRELIARNDYTVTIDSQGYPRIQLGKGHYAATKSGSQYLSRFVTMHSTGDRLRSDEQVHHVNGNKLNCLRDNLEVWLTERHGRHHARTQLLYMLRDHKGKFAKSSVPPYGE